MDTKALRQKILDLAIRGKLVPQDPNDEPASVLLERIREQKQQMVKEGKLKPKDIKNDTIIYKGEDNLHYEKFQDGTVKCIEDEIPFDVPEGWEWCRLTSISLQVTDGEHKTPHRIDNYKGYYLLSARNIQNGYISLDKVDYVDKDEYERISKRCNPQSGDLLISCSGSIGRIAVVDDTNKYVMVRSAAMVRPISINPYYLMFALQSGKLQEQIQKSSKQTAQANLFQGAILSLLVPIPPHTEVLRIIKQIQCLLTLENQINENKDSLYSIISLIKSKILDLAVRGQLVPQDSNDEPASILLERIRAEKEELIKQGKIKRDKKESIIFKGEDNSYYEKIGEITNKIDDEIPFEIPDSWAWCRLKTVCKKMVDGSHNPPKGLDSKTKYIMASSRNIIYDKVSDLNNVRYLNERDFIKENCRTNIEIDDILLTTVATLGRSCIYSGFPENLCFQRSVTVITTCISSAYLKAFFDASYFQNHISNNATGTAQKGFYLNQLEDVMVCVPPLSEQEKISNFLLRTLSHICNIEKSLS